MDHALDRKTALGIFVGLFLVYWIGRCHTFGPGDSPQHVMSALVWGVSKAPGYPLYTALAHLFSLILPGGRAAAVNGFSGLLHAYAAALFYLFLRRQGASVAGALSAVALLSFGRLFWFYSGVAEVRPLNDLLALAAASAALTWSEAGDRASLTAFAVATGLGLSHHPTFALLLPALVFLAATGRRRPRAKDAALFAAVAAAACAAPYVLLWLRLKVSSPAYNFENARTARDVAALFLRESTGGPLKMFPGAGALGFTSFSLAKLVKHAGWFLQTVCQELGPAGLVLAALGVWECRKCGRRTMAFWGLWVAGSASYFLLVSSQTFPLYDEAYAKAVLARFYLLPLIGLCAPAAFGAQWIEHRSRPALVWALCAALALGPALLRPMSHRGRDPLMTYARQIVSSSKDGDLLVLVADDSLFAARYLDVVEHALADRVILVPGFFKTQSYIDDLKSRHPSLNLPTTESGVLSTDWRAWKKLNPERRVLAEGALLGTIRKQYPNARPRGMLVELTDEKLRKKDVLPDIDRFIADAGQWGLDKFSVRDFTQEIYVLRVYQGMLFFYGTFLPPDDVERGVKLQQLYYGL